ncbi:hypothetical protein WEI85_21860 [Actinomycetes bacterium KLBMP 9797]
MSERQLAEALRDIADAAVVPSLPDNLWRRGQRRHRRRVAAATLAVAVVAVLVALPLARHRSVAEPVAPADVPSPVPSIVYAPLPWQRTVQQAPVGPAALIVTGEGAFRGSDVFGGNEGRTVVVGRDGRYRLVNGPVEVEAGWDAHLSPDGRFVAVGGPVEGGADAPFDSTSIVDLTTGRVRVYAGNFPAGWSPDGRHLLLHGNSRLVLLDVASGETQHMLGNLADPRIAFAADGARLAVQDGPLLSIVDVASGKRGLPITLEPRRYLAGPGAWTPDGRIAFWDTIAGCEEECRGPAPEVGEFRLSLVDPRSAATVPGPAVDVVRGHVPRLLGWQPDGDAIVQTYHPPHLPGGGERGPQVIALRPGGGQTLLVDLPDQAHSVEVAQDLLRADRFGGAPPLTARLGDWISGLMNPLTLVAAALLGALVVRYLRRRRRGMADRDRL